MLSVRRPKVPQVKVPSFFEPHILRSSQQELSYRLDPQETLLVKSSEPKIKKLLRKKANKNRSQGPILNETSNPQSLKFCYMLRKQILQMQLRTNSLLISGSFLDEISNSGVDFGSQLQQRSILNSLPLCVLHPRWSIIRIRVLEVLTLTEPYSNPT